MPAPTVTGAKPVEQANLVQGNYALVQWDLTTADPTGTAVSYVDFADRTIQIIGDATAFGGATCAIEGSLDGGTTYVALTDPQGNALTRTAACLESISEAVPLLRARLPSVGVAATVKVMLFARKSD